MSYICTRYMHDVDGKEYHKGRIIGDKVVKRHPQLLELGWVEIDKNTPIVTISGKSKVKISKSQVKRLRHQNHGKKNTNKEN